MAGWQFRPAKQIQRLVSVDVMRRLGAFRPLNEYRYVGMGGYEFVDFDLVHRALGVHRMTSIESSGNHERFKFNRPFKDVELEFGTTNTVLPTLALDDPLIVWLDYCCPLRHDVLQDIMLLGEHLTAGSMMLITVNAEVAPDGERIARLEGRVGASRRPIGVNREQDLDGWLTADVQRRILLSELRNSLAKRSDGMRFEQLLNVNYRDTTRMQTWGGVFVDAGTDGLFRAGDFRSLEQVRTGPEALNVSVPVLTAREVLELESKLVKSQPAPSVAWLKRREAEAFAELHRWYPPVPAPM